MSPIDLPDFSRRELIAAGGIGAMALAGATLTSPPAAAPPIKAATGSLRARADRKGLLCGSCLDVTQVDDAALVAALRRDCNILVPENGFNWTRTQISREGPLEFGQAEAVYAIARRIGVPMRGHVLIYYAIIPKWLREIGAGISAPEMAEIMTRYIRGSVLHWGTRLVHHEVVNEPINADGLNMSVFSEKLGEHYIDLAFHTAREHAPATTPLFLNQDIVEMDSREHARRRASLLRLLERLLSRGVPVQGLGIEGHLTLETPFSERIYRDFLAEVSGMGLQILVSEFDIHDRGANGGVAERDAAVGALGKAFLDVSFDNPACLGMLDWSHSDRDNWLRKIPDKQRSDRQPLRPSPLDDTFGRKPLWSAIAAAYDGAPARRRVPPGGAVRA